MNQFLVLWGSIYEAKPNADEFQKIPKSYKRFSQARA